MGELMCCELGAGDVVWNGAGDVLKNGYWEGCNWEFGEKSFCVDFGLDTSSPSENASTFRSPVSSEEEILFNRFEENGE